MSKEQMDSVMIDLETMATGPNAALIQIGAMAFDSREGIVDLDMFEIDVDLDSAIQAGGRVTASTIGWWAEQGGVQLLSMEPVLIGEALETFAEWLGRFPKVQRVWAQGPSFDIAILEGYYERLRKPVPWAYNAARDTRTVYDLARERGWDKPEGMEPVHRGLEDCHRQLTCLMSALNVLRGNPEGESKIG
ncbi:exonuclease [Bordetella phage MW2]|uniref:Exonuclease n=1 Tax=Bordetella phage MW2 TaxID=1916126 RepID=A0A2D0W961_9CAUD|nr:exonuclease [Bordetella phage MW2]APL99176.1 exonuclease [Bordetella phage MW2]